MQDSVTDEYAEEAHEEQHNQADEKHTVTGGEVIFGLWEEEQSVKITVTSECDECTCHVTQEGETVTNLQREDDHGEAHKCCDADSHDHSVSVVEAGDHPHHVGHG